MFTVMQTVGQTHPVIKVPFKDADGNPMDWTDYESVVFYMMSDKGTKKVDGKNGSFPEPRTGGELQYAQVTADVDTAGTYYGQFKATNGASVTFAPSYPSDLKIVIRPGVGG